jgi:hypothetical protein
LFETELSYLNHECRVYDGVCHLEESVFLDTFLPLLYRHLLLDIVHFATRSSLYGLPLTERRFVLNDYYFRIIPEFPSVLNELFAFYSSLQIKYSSPLYDILLGNQQKREEEEDEKKKKKKGGEMNNSPVVDIEDLFANPRGIMPPCLSPLVEKEWCKNWDRYNLVPFLIDMGYTDRDMIISQMCRHKDSLENRETVGSIYDAALRRRKPNGRISVNCGTIINSIGDEGNIFRCPYEEKKNGQKRRKNHHEKEKASFTSQCACTLSPSLKIYSPLDYINFNLERK